MRDRIRSKFSEVKHKWFIISLASKEFQVIIDSLTNNINDGFITTSDAIDIVTLFMQKKHAWLKLKTVRGRKSQYCECILITKANKKIPINLSCDVVLNASILQATPKSLGYFKLLKRSKRKVFDDTFVDPISIATDELSIEGFESYKAWNLEIKQSGLSRDEYIKTIYPHGYTLRS
jgi:hypothetical protein